MHLRYRFKLLKTAGSAGVMAAASAALMLSIGCSKPAAPTPAPAAATQSAPAPATDSQIVSQVQAGIASEDALKNLPIQVAAANGVVTLSGSVSDEAARELAANDAAQAQGVRTVINNLTVSAAAPAPAAPAPRDQAVRNETSHHQDARTLAHRAAARPRPIQNPAPAQTPVVQNTPPPPPPVVAQPVPVQPVAAPPPPQPVQELIPLPAGTDIPIRISESLETGVTKSNTPFHGAVLSDLMMDGVVAIPRGSSVVGRVIQAKDAAHFEGSAQLSMELTQLTVAGGLVPLVTNPLVQDGPARGKNTVEKSVGGALFGTLIGALAGGGKGALLGAATGAGAGAGVNAVTRGQELKIPSESILHFKLKDAIQITVLVPAGNPSGNGNGSDPALQQRP